MSQTSRRRRRRDVPSPAAAVTGDPSMAGITPAAPEAAAPEAAEPAAIEALDRAFLRIRRAMVKPISTTVPLPSLGRPCDLAKVLACETIATLSDAAPADASSRPTVKDVAAAMELDHSTTSRLLGDAEAEGLIARGTDPADRRRTTVELTDVGRALVQDATSIRRWFLAETFRTWDDQDVVALATVMDRVAATFAERGEQVRTAAHERFGAALQTYQP